MFLGAGMCWGKQPRTSLYLCFYPAMFMAKNAKETVWVFRLHRKYSNAVVLLLGGYHSYCR